MKWYRIKKRNNPNFEKKLFQNPRNPLCGQAQATCQDYKAWEKQSFDLKFVLKHPSC